jgi:phosphoribosyl-AMP cyclohydrolase
MKILDELKFDSQGLIAAIAQDESSGEVLMMAWMNKDSLRATIETRRATYWSRSRKKLWTKGEESGNIQEVRSVHVDCDADAVLLKVHQVGGAACHTGRRSCFYREIVDGGKGFKESGEILFNPSNVYKR